MFQGYRSQKEIQLTIELLKEKIANRLWDLDVEDENGKKSQKSDEMILSRFSQILSELELKEIDHRDGYSSTVMNLTVDGLSELINYIDVENKGILYNRIVEAASSIKTDRGEFKERMDVSIKKLTDYVEKLSSSVNKDLYVFCLTLESVLKTIIVPSSTKDNEQRGLLTACLVVKIEDALKEIETSYVFK